MDIIRGNERGRADHGWLNSRHTFSFGGYYDPSRMGFGVLRVINDDRVAPGGGFPTHPHRDMEIVSYVVEGGLEHKDTLGTGTVIRPGEVQRMSAGTGVAHSEFNASREVPVRFLQIWIFPESRSRTPGYAQKAFPEPEDGTLQPLVSRDGEGGTVSIGQDVRILRFKPRAAGEGRHTVGPGRAGFVQVVSGQLALQRRADGATESLSLVEGDGVALPEPGTYTLSTHGGAEALFFDLPEVNHV